MIGTARKLDKEKYKGLTEDEARLSAEKNGKNIMTRKRKKSLDRKSVV